MDSRRDAACAVAELALYLEQRVIVPDLSWHPRQLLRRLVST
jgi:hypothetical protein